MGKSLYSVAWYSLKGRWALSTPQAANTAHRRAKAARSMTCIILLVCQIVDEIVHRGLVRERRPLFQVARIVGPLPGVAHIHVVADRRDDAALRVANAAPVRLFTARTFFVRET